MSGRYSMAPVMTPSTSYPTPDSIQKGGKPHLTIDTRASEIVPGRNTIFKIEEDRENENFNEQIENQNLVEKTLALDDGTGNSYEGQMKIVFIKSKKTYI